MNSKSNPLPRTRDELLGSLRRTELPKEFALHLAAQARPALLLTTLPAGAEQDRLGASRLGGAPDLPVGVAWPERPAYADASERADVHRQEAAHLLQDSKRPNSWMTPEDGERFSRTTLALADAVGQPFPLTFFGQFDLAALSRIEGFDAMLPTEGRLLVFYDFWETPEDFTPEAAVGWRVIWDSTPVSALARASIPAPLRAMSDIDGRTLFKPAMLSATPIVTPIPSNDPSWDAFNLKDRDLRGLYEDWLEEFGTPDQPDGENHQLGGYPRTVQEWLQASAQLAANGINCGNSEAWHTPRAKSLLPGAKSWRLLIQIGHDANTGMDGPGAYYVVIREEDLTARRFDQARVTYQCD